MEPLTAATNSNVSAGDQRMRGTGDDSLRQF
jgi:hypothetical protein